MAQIGVLAHVFLFRYRGMWRERSKSNNIPQNLGNGNGNAYERGRLGVKGRIGIRDSSK